MNYRALAARALEMALRSRAQYGLDLTAPVSIYDLCDDLGISVRFVDINMEGIYVREPNPRIVISTLRPLVRRNFTCAHELGHHLFGHGSNLDLLASDKGSTKIPDEFLVDSFASFFLMPALGIRRAFAVRGWDLKTASPQQIFTIACAFGVGYTTLINYLLYSVRGIVHSRAKELLRSSPQQIKETLLDTYFPGPLVVVDNHWQARTVDLEVGSSIIMPEGALPTNDILRPLADCSLSTAFVACRPGIVRVSDSAESWGIFVRVMPAGFVGLAKYRHLEGEAGELP